MGSSTFPTHYSSVMHGNYLHRTVGSNIHSREGPTSKTHSHGPTKHILTDQQNTFSPTKLKGLTSRTHSHGPFQKATLNCGPTKCDSMGGQTFGRRNQVDISLTICTTEMYSTHYRTYDTMWSESYQPRKNRHHPCDYSVLHLCQSRMMVVCTCWYSPLAASTKELSSFE